MSEDQLLEIIERYLDGEMSADERIRFEAFRKENADVNKKVIEHKQFLDVLKQYGERIELEKRLNGIHDEIDVHTLKEDLMLHPSFIVQLWRHHHSKISVAASIAIFAILSTLFFTGHLTNNNNSSYIELRREIGSIKRSTEKLDRSIHDIKSGKRPANFNPGKYGGTGFAVTSGGIIVTNYHVIIGADSVYVQNVAGESFRAKIIYTEPARDIAVLKIEDSTFKTLSAIPYNMKKGESDLGEDIYTLGYPGDTRVVGKGYLAAESGINGDTLRYQVSIPVNPGNSGGPMMDSKGNVIGIINAEQSRVEGAQYAIKSSYLVKALQNIPADSLSKKIVFNNKNALNGLTMVQQIKKLKDFVFMVKVYN